MLGSSKFQHKKKKSSPMFPHYIPLFICNRDGEGEHQSKTLQLTFSQREWMVQVLFYPPSAKVALILQSLLLPLPLQQGALCVQFSLLLACSLCKVVPCGLGTGNRIRREWGTAAAGLQQHSVLQRLLPGSCWGTQTVAAPHLGERMVVRRMIRNQESGTRSWLFIQKTTGISISLA